MCVVWGSRIWRFTSFYGNLVSSSRCVFWDLLRRIYNNDDFAWVVGGDFNEILGNHEKIGGENCDVHLISNFQKIIDDCALQDLGFTGGLFTWCNRRNANKISLRLDNFFANDEFLKLFSDY